MFNWGATLAFLGIFAVFMLIFVVICYVADSILKMKIFRLFGPCEPVMAWVPFLSSYYLGRCCNGKDGQNIGIFGMSVPNYIWNFGWAASFVISAIANMIHGLTGLEFVFAFSNCASFVIPFLYYGCVYSFLYSRIEGKPEPEVRVISIVSALVGLVGLVKILSYGVDNVYSLPNDEFPVEQKAGPNWNEFEY